jgi:putative flippase GtrA
LGFSFINRELASHIFGTGFGFFTNFFGHKLVTFRSTGIMVRIAKKK